MIHSMSGGVLAENASERFVKVEVDGGSFWYLSKQRVKAGDEVEVPRYADGQTASGRVVRVEFCSAQTAPYPMRRVKEIIRVLPRREG